MLGKKSEHELSNVYAIIKPAISKRKTIASKERKGETFWDTK